MDNSLNKTRTQEALQNNLGTVGVVVVTLYKMGFPEAVGSFRTHQIKAAPIGSAVGRFKANLVFKETEKKLKEEGEQFVKKLVVFLPSR